MRSLKSLGYALLFIAATLVNGSTLRAQTDPLPSWNDTAPKKAILDFVARVTTPGSKDFVRVEERIATFDNDGTLWCEKPFYFQMAFAFDRVKAMPVGAALFTELLRPGFLVSLTGSVPALVLLSMAAGLQLLGFLVISRLAKTGGPG